MVLPDPSGSQADAEVQGAGKAQRARKTSKTVAPDAQMDIDTDPTACSGKKTPGRARKDVSLSQTAATKRQRANSAGRVATMPDSLNFPAGIMPAGFLTPPLHVRQNQHCQARRRRQD